jgi:hypothetical protein
VEKNTPFGGKVTGQEITKEYKQVMFPIGQLEDADYNPRSISATMMEKLKKGLLEFGCVQPIVANGATAHFRGNAKVVGGHQRLAAAKALGWTEINTIIINEPSVMREKALNLALNKISGEWQFDKLGEMLSELNDGDFDIELSGFDALELKELEGLDESIMDANLGNFEPPRSAESPNEFPTFDESIHTDFQCPKCSYAWSGKAKP